MSPLIENEKNVSLPKGWKIKKLGELGKVSMCKRILKKQTSPTGDIPFYKIGTFGKTPNAYISKKVYEDYQSKYSFPKKGDILLSASGTIGRRVAYDGNPAYFQDSNIVWIDNNETKVLNEYLYKFYGFCNWNPSRGATISRLYNDDLRNIEIPIPPLPEQKRIVAILDEAFSAIEQSRKNAEKNLQNAKELFQSKLQSIFENGKSKVEYGDETLSQSKGWKEKELRDVCEVYNGSTPLRRKKEFWNDGNINWFTVDDIRRQGRIITYTKQKITEEGYKSTSLKILPPKSVLICCTASVGEYAMTDVSLTTNQQFNGLVIKDKSILMPDYLYYFVSTLKRKLLDLSGKTTIDFVSMTKLKEIKISIPPLPEQKQIVTELDALQAECKKLELIYQQKLDSLEELKKSILQKAFNGEL